jgi:ABC-type multidrug transport system fused ATPase/permease subunit
MSLLRFVDPSEGSITVDGIDITQIGLNDLRSRVVGVSHIVVRQILNSVYRPLFHKIVFFFLGL